MCGVGPGSWSQTQGPRQLAGSLVKTKSRKVGLAAMLAPDACTNEAQAHEGEGRGC